jgi:hypothetical protein
VNDIWEIDDDCDPREVVPIRQAFYEGLSRACLKAAWSRVDILRGDRKTFLEKPAPSRGVSQGMIAMSLDRTTGEVCRWLQGRSPDWANLMVVLVALDASWSELDGMPTKSERKRGGYAQALAVIRQRLPGGPAMPDEPPTPTELHAMESLFGHPQWEASRRVAAPRMRVLKIVARQRHIDEAVLDAADRAWGKEFGILQRAYLQSLDVALWR